MTKEEAAALKEKIAKEKPKLGDLVKLPQSPVAVSKLSIACGQNKPKGFKGIDLGGDADIQHDLFTFPWPIKSSSVREVECSHFVEHIPHYGLKLGANRTEPGDPDGFFIFWDEVYRIMRKGAMARIVHPYSMSARADWDPSHTRRIHELTWYYLNQEWRELNKLDHYPIACNFEVVNIDATGLSDEFMTRSPEQQMMQRTNYWNVVSDLVVTLKAL